MKKSTYNERFSFENPGSRQSASRSTLYRAKKKQKLQTEVLQDEMESSDSCDSGPVDESPVSPTQAPETECGDVESATNSPISLALEANLIYGLEKETDSNAEEAEGVPLYSSTSSPLTLEESNLTHPIAEFGDVESATNNPICLEANLIYGLDKEADSNAEEAEGVPLYPLTLEGSNVAIMHYKTRHNLTDEAISDLIQLLNLHGSSIHPTSVFQLKRFFRDEKVKAVEHFFCSCCLMESSEFAKTCSNSLCAIDFSLSGDKSELPVEAQLQALFQRKLRAMYM